MHSEDADGDGDDHDEDEEGWSIMYVPVVVNAPQRPVCSFGFLSPLAFAHVRRNHHNEAAPFIFFLSAHALCNNQQSHTLLLCTRAVLG